MIRIVMFPLLLLLLCPYVSFVCVLSLLCSGGLEYQFLRESLVKAEIAHLDNKGNLIQGKRASRRQKRGMAQTYTITWKDAESKATTTLPITQYGLGRKVLLMLAFVVKKLWCLELLLSYIEVFFFLVLKEVADPEPVPYR